MSRVKGSPKTGGNKKGNKHKATIVAENFFEKVKEELDIELNRDKKAIIKGTVKALSKGNPMLVKDTLDRVFGKVKEQIELETKLPVRVIKIKKYAKK